MHVELLHISRAASTFLYVYLSVIVTYAVLNHVTLDVWHQLVTGCLPACVSVSAGCLVLAVVPSACLCLSVKPWSGVCPVAPQVSHSSDHFLLLQDFQVCLWADVVKWLLNIIQDCLHGLFNIYNTSGCY